MAQEKELKKLKIYLKTKQLNKVNELPLEGSLSIKIEKLIDIALAAIKIEGEKQDA